MSVVPPAFRIDESEVLAASVAAGAHVSDVAAQGCSVSVSRCQAHAPVRSSQMLFPALSGADSRRQVASTVARVSTIVQSMVLLEA